MSKEMQKIPDEELKGTAGGGDWMTWNGDNFQLWMSCPSCGYSEKVASGFRDLPCRFTGEWFCPKCYGGHQKYELVNKIDAHSQLGPYYTTKY